jgi:lipopolysaccharide/colanic/teichoic acid biosynthesis glycosyltransferase
MGMSRQDGNVALNAALASLFAIIFSFFVIRRLLRFPFMRIGPIIYRQQRAGFGCRPFTIFKLRTMTHNHGGGDYTLKDDERVTRIGRFLRHFIDELPQIINILCGGYELIGPRPEAMSLERWYEREVPFYVYRRIIQPGIAGRAQVHQGSSG